jgi:hypothetical protein
MSLDHTKIAESNPSGVQGVNRSIGLQYGLFRKRGRDSVWVAGIMGSKTMRLRAMKSTMIF